MEGKLVQSGGMVVKNVAGLDMGKLLIGSLGTLAAITVVNFKLIPMPPLSRTFVFSYRMRTRHYNIATAFCKVSCSQ
jgi:glycolate oxidase FAD binding subunit